MLAVSGLILSRLTDSTPTPVLLGGYLIFGLGFGMLNAPITNAAVSGMPRVQAGVAAAIASTSRQVGASLGVAIVGTVLTARLTGPLETGFVPAARLCWYIIAGCGVLVLVLGLITTGRWARRHRRQGRRRSSLDSCCRPAPYRSGLTVDDWGRRCCGSSSPRATWRKVRARARRPDPLWEIANSLDRLQTRRGRWAYAPWYRVDPGSPDRDPYLARDGHDLLLPLFPRAAYFPDFLTPPAALDGLDAGHRGARSPTPPERVTSELKTLALVHRAPSWAPASGCRRDAGQSSALPCGPTTRR